MNFGPFEDVQPIMVLVDPLPAQYGDEGLTWKCLQIQCFRAENIPATLIGTLSSSPLEPLWQRACMGESSRCRGERSNVLRGEGGGVLEVELHTMAGILAARGLSWIGIAEREREGGKERGERGGRKGERWINVHCTLIKAPPTSGSPNCLVR